MHRPIMDGIMHRDPDTTFVQGMTLHHQGAIDMAEVQLRYGPDHHNRELARTIIETQTEEVAGMRDWLRHRDTRTQ